MNLVIIAMEKCISTNSFATLSNAAAHSLSPMQCVTNMKKVNEHTVPGFYFSSPCTTFVCSQ